MKKVPLTILSAIVAIHTFGQVRISKLIIKSKEVYELGSTDILVMDTLILMDSAKMVLNKLKRENYIRAQVAIFGKGSIIDGCGASGKNGRNGKEGDTPYAPCKNGLVGKMGARGLDGAHGVNLFLYFENMIINGKLSINISGGNGGNGGDGGTGGNGSQGTVQCNGGNGGDGGNAGQGGNGGDGGILTFSCKTCANSALLVRNSIGIIVEGGAFGYGGRGGDNGVPGLGVARKSRSGVPGRWGQDGQPGKSGNTGSLKFEEN